MKKNIFRILSLLLAVCMLVPALVSCMNRASAPEKDPAIGNNISAGGDELSREELETIVGVLDEDADPSELTDEELEELAGELLGELGGGAEADELTDRELSELAAELLGKTEQKQDPADPGVDVSENKEAYDENGAMKLPFDEVYPELIEDGGIEFSGESLLIKMPVSIGGRLTDGLSAAGVGSLETVVELEGYTWYKASLKAGTDAQSALAFVRELGEVSLAEYDYVVKTASIDEYRDIDEALGFENNKHKKDQWYLHHCGIPEGFNYMKYDGGKPSVIVAVIDTGIDIDHEDLEHNIWKNTAEKPDNGVDDDGNGYIDDYYGVNIISGKGSGDDDNGHGTHVAGIIAARNNNLGTVGIAHKVTVMPVKAASASGYLLQSDIAKAVLYAYEHGAEVINMSFGGSACSIAVQDALATAYTRCVLVASAGNEGMPNEHETLPSLPNYPAALSYVLGVMAVDKEGTETYFTNWDHKAYNGVEYELYAPGYDIMSTLPDNRYGSLSGTSMAAPVVSAMAAILRSEFEDRDTYPTKFIYGQLASTSEHYAACLDPEAHKDHNLPQIADLYSALTKLPKPEVGVQEHLAFDTAGLAGDTAKKNNGDGVIDAGETISLGLVLRNRWGMSKNTVVTIDARSAAGVADPYITFVNPTVNYDTVGTYSTQDCGRIYTDGLHTGWENPFIVKIADNCPNDYIVSVNVHIEYENGIDGSDRTVYTAEDTFTFTVRNGVILPSVIDGDMTLTPDNLYIIPNSTVIEPGVTVRVLAGTNIRFWSDDPSDPYADTYVAFLSVKGRFLVEGTKEAPVRIYPSELMSQYNVDIRADAGGYVSLVYADVTNLGVNRFDNLINYADHCTFRASGGKSLRFRTIGSGSVGDTSTTTPHLAQFGLVENSVFYRIGLANGNYYHLSGNAERCIFADCGINFKEGSFTSQSCVFLGNTYVDQTTPNVYRRSSMTLKSPDALSVSSVLYREETGTTYVRSGEIDPLVLEKLGGTYLVLNDSSELSYLQSKMTSGIYSVGVRYDEGAGCFVWCDGTPVDTAVYDKNGVLTSANRNKPIVFALYSPVYFSQTSSSNHIYEIPGKILPAEITFENYEVIIDTETEYQLSPISAPVQFKPGEFVYESCDESVVKVSSTGLVTPVGKGRADVYVYSEDRAVYNYVTFNVADCVPLESFTFEAHDRLLAIGDTARLKVAFSPIDTTRKQLTYSSSDESVLTVDTAGNITAVSSGTATVTAACDGITRSVEIRCYVRTAMIGFSAHAMQISLSAGTAELPAVITSAGAECELSWRSTDTNVATVEDGRLTAVAAGTTTLVVTDNYSGLSSSILLIVREEAASRIKKFGKSDGYNAYYVLMENGDLYEWTSDTSPALIDKGVADFAAASWGAYNRTVKLFSDGKLLVSIGAGSGGPEFTCFSGIGGIERVALNAYGSVSLWCITDTGSVYAYGENSQGQLGIGTSSDAEEAQLVNLDNVVDIKSDEKYTLFLTSDGNLYYSGNTVNLPTHILDGVKEITNKSSNSFTYYCIDGTVRAYTIGSGNGKSLSLDRSFDSVSYGVDIINGSGFNGIGIKDGRAYEIHAASATTQIPGISNAVYSYSDGQTHYIVTDDGMLYGIGKNNPSSNSFAGASGEAVVTVPVPILLEKTSEQPSVTELVQTGDSFRLTFNKALGGVSPKLYADGVQATVQYELSGVNELTISRANGFSEGVVYSLVFEADTLHCAGGITNSEEITLTLTYDPSLAAPDLPETEAPVIHESMTDTSIERVWTAESLLAEINAIQAEHQYNSRFYGNAILNRLSTDTTLDHWLRPVAPSNEGKQLPLGGNWWGSTDERAIELQMVDYGDYISYGRFMYAPYLTEAPEDTFPFVTSVKIFNKHKEEVSTVGNEQMTVRITFNRDMDTSIPLSVRFGSAYPYGDYELDGKWTDARTWEGKYKLTTLIEGGIQYFTIENGCSAEDDLVLMRDRARFSFEIDTTAAQALIMQGEATDTGVSLRWTQDDFDTLMGYNVYRATSEDGLYTRLNSSVIPADTMEFFDSTVEPGVVYYYNFTVVQTDLSESTPSGKIVIMSRDTMAPDIYHSPVYNATTGSNLIISATVTDNLNITYARVYYRTSGEESWRVAVMNKLNDKYSAIIIADHLSVEGLEYYIEAFDGVSHTYKGSETEPYLVTVQETVSGDAIGDVNGDGAITNLDALMLLKAINDQLNLTAEEFARADLDGNGSLAAKEALRILQYVSGAVGSVDMRS